MYIDLKDLFWLSLIVLFGLHWWRGQRVKEIALRATRRHCDELDLQLLDESIGLRAIWLRRDAGGRLRWWRSYTFEFTSSGDDRYRGRVVTLGDRVESIQVAPHRI